MAKKLFDVDIDVKPSLDRTKYGTRATVYNEDSERITPHPSGVYIEPVPVDALTGNAAFDYKRGDEVGFNKVDMLSNTSYLLFKSKNDLLDSIAAEPDWDFMMRPDVFSKLPHIANHRDLVIKVRPRSIMELADCLALIRPGKVSLLDQYIKNRELTRRNLYRRPKDGVFFKKSHAVSYAVMIVAVANKIKESSVVW